MKINKEFVYELVLLSVIFLFVFIPMVGLLSLRYINPDSCIIKFDKEILFLICFLGFMSFALTFVIILQYLDGPFYKEVTKISLDKVEINIYNNITILIIDNFAHRYNSSYFESVKHKIEKHVPMIVYYNRKKEFISYKINI